MKDRYTLHFFILFLGVFAASVFFYLFKYNLFAQTIIAFSGCMFYIMWGIMHHAVRDRLTKLVAIEYVLVGSLIFLLLFISLSA